MSALGETGYFTALSTSEKHSTPRQECMFYLAPLSQMSLPNRMRNGWLLLEKMASHIKMVRCADYSPTIPASLASQTTLIPWAGLIHTVMLGTFSTLKAEMRGRK